MNYGHHIRDLLIELKSGDGGGNGSSSNTVKIPAYNDASVTGALQDLKLHVQALDDQVEANRDVPKPPMSVRPSMLLQDAAIQRNKRGLLAYHWERVQRIQEYCYWQQSGSSNSNDSSTNETTKNLCPAELDFLSKYQALIENYTESVLPGAITDIRAHCTAPPLPVDKVSVRVINSVLGDDDDDDDENCEVMLESGQTANFTLGSTHYLSYTDCEEYIRSGVLIMIGTE